MVGAKKPTSKRGIGKSSKRLATDKIGVNFSVCKKNGHPTEKGGIRAEHGEEGIK